MRRSSSASGDRNFPTDRSRRPSTRSDSSAGASARPSRRMRGPGPSGSGSEVDGRGQRGRARRRGQPVGVRADAAPAFHPWTSASTPIRVPSSRRANRASVGDTCVARWCCARSGRVQSAVATAPVPYGNRRSIFTRPVAQRAASERGRPRRRASDGRVSRHPPTRSVQPEVAGNDAVPEIERLMDVGQVRGPGGRSVGAVNENPIRPRCSRWGFPRSQSISGVRSPGMSA